MVFAERQAIVAMIKLGEVTEDEMLAVKAWQNITECLKQSI
jgi:hypothetical protein